MMRSGKKTTLPVKQKVKSKVVMVEKNSKGASKSTEGLNKPDQVEFEEDGHLIQMEINATDNDFESEEDEQQNDNDTESVDSESDVGSDEDNENQTDTEHEAESSEVTEEENSLSQIDENPSEDDAEMETQEQPAVKVKRKKKKSQRSSLESRLDTMSSALLAVKDILVLNGLADPKGATKAKKDEKRNTGNSPVDESVTTIYQNALEQITDLDDPDIAPEVTFRPKQLETDQQVDPINQNSNESIHESVRNRESTSSEDRIDTSDELLQLGDDMDINDKFIADCAAEARRRKRSYPDDELKNAPRDMPGHSIIEKTEAGKIPMNKTAGNDNLEVLGQRFSNFNVRSNSMLVDENYLMIGQHLDVSLQDKIK